VLIFSNQRQAEKRRGGFQWTGVLAARQFRLGEITVFFGGDQNIINRRKTTWVID
jgi:hypothetical protein